jgi:ERCC4-type nuclease
MSTPSVHGAYINTEIDESENKKNERRKNADKYEKKRARLKNKISKSLDLITSCMKNPFMDSFLTANNFTDNEIRYYKSIKDDYEKSDIFISEICTKNVEIMESFLKQLYKQYGILGSKISNF